MTLTDTEAAYTKAALAGDRERADELAALIDLHQREQEERLSAPGALLNAALWYASQGIAVFPCVPGGKRPATKHGFKDASTDADQIRAWWKVNTAYNIGLPTGQRFDVVDLDGPEGLIAYGNMLDSGQAIAPVAVALTPRGRHYYVHPTGAGNGTNVGGMSKVDYRGAGGYVIAPPSRVLGSGVYRWTVDRPLRPELLPPAEVVA